MVVLDHLNETQRRAYIIADNKLALNAGWDEALLAEELRELESEGLDLALVGFSDEELEALLAMRRGAGPAAEVGRADSGAPGRAGHPAWRRVADRKAPADLRRLPGPWLWSRQLLDGARANVCITSPPYATQREYDPSTGFRPIPPEEYVRLVSRRGANVAAVLADDGSYFLNIKEHADDGERSLYVKDLVIAHRRAVGLAIRGRVLLAQDR